MGLKRKGTLESVQGKDMISLQQLVENLAGSGEVCLSREEAYRVARYIVEDGTNRADDSAAVGVALARQVLRNLLKREL